MTVPYRLLVIDDEDGVLEMIRGHFSLRGFRVFTAPDGGEGIRLCGEVRPDAVLLDIKMKKMDGDRAVPALKAAHPPVKIFVVSAYQDEILRKKVGGLGVEKCFEKPVSILTLEREIREALAGNAVSDGVRED